MAARQGQAWRWLGALLIAGLVAAAAAQDGAAADGGVAAAQRVEVTAGSELVVRCWLAVGARPQWARDGQPVPGDMRPGEAVLGQRLQATLTAARATAGHQGRYSCQPGGPSTAVTVLPASTASETTEQDVLARSGGGGGGGDFDGAELLWYEVRKNLSLSCSDVGSPVEWRKNGTLVGEIPELMERVEILEGGRRIKLVPRAREDDWGNWSCSGPNGDKKWRVQGRPYAWLPSDSGVVEGQRLKLVCKVVGKPYPPVQWLYNSTDMGNNTRPVLDIITNATMRTSEQGVLNGELVIEPAQRKDAGQFHCVPEGSESNQDAWGSTTLRVKDMYAALWPFLGIVGEVVILCAVILVYERRRQPQLDDSDTDNHDQKKS